MEPKTSIQQNATLLASRGQYDRAIAEWKKLAAESPNDGTIYNNIGDLHLKRNAPAEAVEAYLQAGAAFQAAGSALKAIAVYKKVLKVDPSRYRVYQFLGDLHAERGLVTNALSDYMTLGKLYLKDGLTKDALAVYRTIVTVDPARLDTRKRLAELCLQEHLNDEAIETYLQLGKACTMQQRPDDAREAYEAVLRINPAHPRAKELLESPESAVDTAAAAPAGGDAGDGPITVEEAQRHIAGGHYDRAETILSELLTMQPGDPEVCRLFGVVYLKRGHLPAARNQFQFLAEAAMRAGDYPAAESMLTDYLEADPNYAGFRELLGRLYENKGDRQAAADQYGLALVVALRDKEQELSVLPAELYAHIADIAPDSSWVTRFAELFGAPASGPSEAPPAAQSSPAPPSEPQTETLIEPGDAITVSAPARTAELPAAVELNADDAAKYHYELGVAYRNMGLFDEAVEEFRAAGGSLNLYLDACGMIAECLKEQGRHDMAIASLEEAVADARFADAIPPSLKYDLGLLYEAEGLTDSAVEIFGSIPSFLDAGQRLERIKKAAGLIPGGGESAAVSAADGQSQKKRRISYL